MARPHELALPPLSLGDWRVTRDRLHRWARYAGTVRRQLLPPRPRWAHASLRVSARGLSTGPFPVPGGAGEIVLDLVAGNLLVFASDGWELHLPLAADPGSPLRERLAGALAELEVDVELPRFDGGSPGPYDPAAAARWLRVVASLDGVLQALRSEGELALAGPAPSGSWSAVQLWPHHFDLALSWFSGRPAAGGAGARGDGAGDGHGDEEHVGLGFSTGDENDPEAYLYAVCHPWPEGVETHPLPFGSWHAAGWRGAFLPWREAVAAPSPLAAAARFWRGARGVLAEALAERGEGRAAGDGASGDGASGDAARSGDPLAEPPPGQA